MLSKEHFDEVTITNNFIDQLAVLTFLGTSCSQDSNLGFRIEAGSRVYTQYFEVYRTTVRKSQRKSKRRKSRSKSYDNSLGMKALRKKHKAKG